MRPLIPTEIQERMLGNEPEMGWTAAPDAEPPLRGRGYGATTALLLGALQHIEEEDGNALIVVANPALQRHVGFMLKNIVGSDADCVVAHGLFRFRSGAVIQIDAAGDETFFMRHAGRRFAFIGCDGAPEHGSGMYDALKSRLGRQLANAAPARIRWVPNE